MREGRRYVDLGRGSIVTAVAFGGLVFAASWYRHATFRSTIFDLAIFEQALWKLAHGTAPTLTMIGGTNAFADHFSPVLLILAPVYRLFPSPVWLLALQAAALAIGYLVVGPLLDALGIEGRVRASLRLAYLVCPLLWNAALFDFHPTTLAVPFLAVSLVAALHDDVAMLAAMAIALVILRDDLGAAVAVAALCGFASLSRRRRWWRVTLLGFGAACLIVGGLVGSRLGSSRYWHPRYSYLGPSVAAAASHPGRSVVRLATHLVAAKNPLLLLAVLLPFGSLPLLSPRRLGLAVLLAFPLLAARDNNFHALVFHYWAPFVPLLMLAAATGVRRLPARLADPHAVVWIGTLAAVSLVTLGPPQTEALTRTTVDPADARHAIGMIRPTDHVVADLYIGPHVANRSVLYSFPAPFDPRREGFSPQAAAAIDAVVIAAPRTPQARHDLEGALRSLEFSALGPPRRFGEVLLYRQH